MSCRWKVLHVLTMWLWLLCCWPLRSHGAGSRPWLFGGKPCHLVMALGWGLAFRSSQKKCISLHIYIDAYIYIIIYVSVYNGIYIIQYNIYIYISILYHTCIYFYLESPVWWSSSFFSYPAWLPQLWDKGPLIAAVAVKLAVTPWTSTMATGSLRVWVAVMGWKPQMNTHQYGCGSKWKT